MNTMVNRVLGSAPASTPIAFVFLHKREQGPNNLAKHGPQMLPWVFSIMYLNSQVGLADTKAICDSISGHPDIYPKACHIAFPDLLFHIEFCYISGKGEITSYRLPDLFTVKSTC